MDNVWRTDKTQHNKKKLLPYPWIATIVIIYKNQPGITICNEIVELKTFTLSVHILFKKKLKVKNVYKNYYKL